MCLFYIKSHPKFIVPCIVRCGGDLGSEQSLGSVFCNGTLPESSTFTIINILHFPGIKLHTVSVCTIYVHE